jgi:hypothetical protein
MTAAHPNAHEYLYERGTSLCRACKAPRDHFIHQLPLVELTMSPLNGMSDPQLFCITVKDGLKLIARVYVSAEDFALALSGRMVKGQFAPRYHSGTRSEPPQEPK